MTARCAICLDWFAPEDLFNPCCIKDDHPSACASCFTAFAERILASSSAGVCPTMHCPLCIHANSSAREPKILRASDIFTICKVPELQTKYDGLIRSTLSFQCAGCHRRSSLFVEATEEERKAALAELSVASMSQKDFDEFSAALDGLCKGSSSLEVCYKQAIALYPLIYTTEDIAIAWSLMAVILKAISEPERRANFHLRYLRDRPFITTRCCNKPHCFYCKTKEWHLFKSCDENCEKFFTGTILSCPNCNVHLTRGDGCDTIECLCKHKFSWSVELSLQQDAEKFLKLYPSYPNSACAHILCGTLCGDAALASAWRKRNRVATNIAILRWVISKFGPCSSQWCSCDKEYTTPFMLEVKSLWKSVHESEVAECLRQNRVAQRELFEALYPTKQMKLWALMRRKSSHLSNPSQYTFEGAAVYASSELWLQDHLGLFVTEKQKARCVYVNQFLCIFGHLTAKSLSYSFASVHSVGGWDTLSSNHFLRFSADGHTATRPGSVSCYPAAFAKLTSPHCRIVFRIDDCPRHGNYMSFGLCTQRFSRDGSNGVGATQLSWGVMDTRDSSSNLPATVYDNGCKVDTWRKYEKGDLVMVEVNTTNGCCEVNLNNGQYSATFAIPPEDVTDPYIFGATFATDHSITIVHVEDADMKRVIPMNYEQSIMFSAYVQFHRQIRDVSASIPDAELGLVVKLSKDWEDRCGGLDRAQAVYDSMKTNIDTLIAADNDLISGSAQNSDFPYLTWRQLSEMLCWSRISGYGKMDTSPELL